MGRACPVKVQTRTSTHKHRAVSKETEEEETTVELSRSHGALWPQETRDNGRPCLMQGRLTHTYCEHTISHYTELALGSYVREASWASPGLPQAFPPVLFFLYSNHTLYIVFHHLQFPPATHTQDSHLLMTSLYNNLSKTCTACK